MSNISYSLYLIHLSIIVWLVRIFPGLTGNSLSILLFVAVSNIAAWLFYFAFERHYPKVRRALNPWLHRLPK